MKFETEFEVYGCWTFDGAKSKCPRCASTLELVPKENHYNSKYWKLKRDDGLDLFCCPNGCDNNFKKVMTDATSNLDEKILKKFYFDNGLDGHELEEAVFIATRYLGSENKRRVKYILIKDFVYNYNGFSSYYEARFNAHPEFIWDRASGIVFFNIFSHEPFKGALYGPLYKNKGLDGNFDCDKIAELIETDKRVVWQSSMPTVPRQYSFDLTDSEKLKFS